MGGVGTSVSDRSFSRSLVAKNTHDNGEKQESKVTDYNKPVHTRLIRSLLYS